MMTFTKTSEQIEVSSKETKANFLQEVMERLEDGILILTNAGEIVHANASAYHLCCQLSQGSFDSQLIPPIIWKLCQLLLNLTMLLTVSIKYNCPILYFGYIG